MQIWPKGGHFPVRRIGSLPPGGFHGPDRPSPVLRYEAAGGSGAFGGCLSASRRRIVDSEKAVKRPERS
jgi:hypothetical protein